jgi:hypothetical protein
MFSTRLKIGLLVAGHIVAGLSLAWLSHDGLHRNYLVSQLRSGLIQAEVGLVGMRAALSSCQMWRRFMTGFAVLTYLFLLDATSRNLIHLGSGFGMYLADFRVQALLFGDFLLIAFSSAMVFCLLSVMNRGQQRLVMTKSVELCRTSVGVQFSIRHWFLATAVFGVLLTIGIGIRGIFTGLAQGQVDFVAVAGPGLVVIQLAILWAGLGTGRALVRLMILLPLTFGIGLVPYCTRYPVSEWVWGRASHWAVICGFVGLITAGSLLVVRSCGYRLVLQTPAPAQVACG